MSEREREWNTDNGKEKRDGKRKIERNMQRGKWGGKMIRKKEHEALLPASAARKRAERRRGGAKSERLNTGEERLDMESGAK